MSDPDKLHSSIVGGSSAERVLACPGSIRLTQMAVNRSSIYAEEGTALHFAMEHILTQDCRPEDVLGMTFHGHVMTEAYVEEALAPALGYFDRIIGERDFELEVRAPITSIPGAFGTADVVVYDGETLVGLFDWKFGEGYKVTAEGNAQMMFYLQAQIDRGLPLPEDGQLFAHIVQPRMQHFEVAWFSVEEVRRFTADLAAAVSGPETFKAGKWCHFCLGKRRCPEKWGKKAQRLQGFTKKMRRPAKKVL